MLRSVLVALDGSVYSETAASLAIEWALRYGARLVALGVVDAPAIQRAEPVPLGAGAYKRARDEARLADAHRRVVEFLTDFRARSQAAGVTTEVLEDINDPAVSVLREAQRCDVVILARETHFHFETQDRPDQTLAQVLRGSPRPVVVVPRELPEGRGVIIAYGGGREAARTLQTFHLLGLAAGEAVEVVSIHRDAAMAEALAAQGGEYLASHGAPHRARAIVSATPPAQVLLEEIRRTQPRLLVMGAHGHHPVRDLFSTSVTRAVLRACPVPAFVGA
ncbi:MAG TPA: universal stress protein [Methylomirabilota bacterium]|jgi:nucleotide-binding universal stress UspA family protein